jgi:hypothetical protein
MISRCTVQQLKKNHMSLSITQTAENKNSAITHRYFKTAQNQPHGWQEKDIITTWEECVYFVSKIMNRFQ